MQSLTRLMRLIKTGERSNLRYLFALCALVTVGFIGCAAQPAPRVEYIDRDCTRAADFAPALWLPVRWITIEVLSPGETLDSRPSLRAYPSLRAERSNLDSSAQKPPLNDGEANPPSLRLLRPSLRAAASGEAIHTGAQPSLYVCTPDGETLLGNLIRFREVK